MKKSLFAAATTMVVVLASLWFIACEKEEATDLVTIPDTFMDTESLNPNEAVDRGNADWIVFGPNSKPYGKSYAEWTVNWMQVFMGFNCKESPHNNPAKALFFKNGPVFFLAGLPKEGGSVKFTVPQGKAILFPLVNYLNEYPCPSQPYEPSPGQSLEKFLRAGALSALADVRGLSVEVDGIPVGNIGAFQFTSRLFPFTGNPELASCLDACITGQPQKAVTSGYYVMLKPLKKGPHVVRYHAESPAFNIVHDGTYYINVI